MELKLKMSLYFDPIDKQHPNRAALMYGPIMLAVKGERNKKLCPRKLYGNIDNPNDWIAPVLDEQLHFTIQGKGNKEQLAKPYYEYEEKEWYYVYSDIVLE